MKKGNRHYNKGYKVAHIQGEGYIHIDTVNEIERQVYEKGYLQGLKDATELDDQPLTSSIWGIPFDENPEYGEVVNFASNGIEDKISAFKYGFKLGWQTCWFEHQKKGQDEKRK